MPTAFLPRNILSGLATAIDRRPTLTRWLLAGPGTLIFALLFMSTMPLWMPAGSSGVEHLIYPVVLAPLFWALAFIYTLIESNLVRCSSFIAGAILLQFLVLLFWFTTQ